MKYPSSSLICLISLAVTAATQRVQAAAIADNTVIFDSYTPPNKGGYSSGNQGNATELSVTTDTRISGFSILNEMTQPGNMRFALLSYPNPQFILLTDPINFSKDQSGVPTWKNSGSFDILLQAGHTYLFGYLHDVGLIDYSDYTAGSQNGITSNKHLHLLAGFASPSYDRLFNSGADGAVRLIAIPESGPSAWVAAFLCVALFRRRRLLAC